MEGCESDPTTSSLLAMAEAFLGQDPPRISDAVRCLLALLTQHPPPRIEARARLELGLTLYHHTNNLLEARENLDKAVLVAQSVANLEEVCFKASSISARILVEQQNLHQAKSLLRSRVEASSHLPYWHLRLLLQLADVSTAERDEEGVVNTLNRCVEYARQVDAPYTRLLCSLYKGALLLVQHRYQEAGEVLNQTSGLMEDYHGQKELLIRTFYLVVQVSHLLVAGQIKAAKPHLKQLQQRVKALSSEQCELQFSSTASTDSRLLAENFQWLTKQETFSMVYLVSVVHSVQGGYLDKALAYSEKAMQFMVDTERDRGPTVVCVLRAHLLEQIVQCLLMKGDITSAAEKMEEVIGICHSHPQLIYAHRPVLHTLLGLYAFATDDLERAAVQLHTALQHTNSGELRTYVSLNLALTYMKVGVSRVSELTALMKALDTDSVTDNCQSLRAALQYVRGLYAFTQLKVHDAKRHLRETLLLSNKGDLNRLTTCSLILLGQIFLSVGNTKETMDMVSPAVQLASKIPDRNLQVWAVTLLADLHHLTGEKDQEVILRQQSAGMTNEIQSERNRALQSRQHTLTQWTVGEWPVSQTRKMLSSDHVNRQSHRPKNIHLDSSSPSSLTTSPAFSQHQPTSITTSQPKKRRRTEEILSPDTCTTMETQDTDDSMLVCLSRDSTQQASPGVRSSGSSSGSSHKASNSLELRPFLKGSPVTIRSPELKLKKVTTPTSMHRQLIGEHATDSRVLEEGGGEKVNSSYGIHHASSISVVDQAHTVLQQPESTKISSTGQAHSSPARQFSTDSPINLPALSIHPISTNLSSPSTINPTSANHPSPSTICPTSTNLPSPSTVHPISTNLPSPSTISPTSTNHPSLSTLCLTSTNLPSLSSIQPTSTNHPSLSTIRPASTNPPSPSTICPTSTNFPSSICPTSTNLPSPSTVHPTSIKLSSSTARPTSTDLPTTSTIHLTSTNLSSLSTIRSTSTDLPSTSTIHPTSTNLSSLSTIRSTSTDLPSTSTIHPTSTNLSSLSTICPTSTNLASTSTIRPTSTNLRSPSTVLRSSISSSNTIPAALPPSISTPLPPYSQHIHPQAHASQGLQVPTHHHYHQSQFHHPLQMQQSSSHSSHRLTSSTSQLSQPQPASSEPSAKRSPVMPAHGPSQQHNSNLSPLSNTSFSPQPPTSLSPLPATSFSPRPPTSMSPLPNTNFSSRPSTNLSSFPNTSCSSRPPTSLPSQPPTSFLPQPRPSISLSPQPPGRLPETRNISVSSEVSPLLMQFRNTPPPSVMMQPQLAIGHSHNHPLPLQQQQQQQQQQRNVAYSSQLSSMNTSLDFLSTTHARTSPYENTALSSVLSQDSSKMLQYQTSMLQKQQEEQLKEKALMKSRQLEQQKILECQQHPLGRSGQAHVIPHQVQGALHQQKFFQPVPESGQQLLDSQSLLNHQHLFQRQQQQQQQQQQQHQQLFLQQAQMQQQYLLQQAAVVRQHPPNLIQPGSSMTYNMPIPPVSVHGQVPGYYSANQATGLTTHSKQAHLPQHVPVQPLQAIPGLVGGGRTAVEQHFVAGGMVPRPSLSGLHRFPGGIAGGGYAQQQNMQLFPNGANLLGSGLVGQQNPTGSPLRHFSHLH